VKLNGILESKQQKLAEVLDGCEEMLAAREGSAPYQKCWMVAFKQPWHAM
jgi:hypothetical protein